MPVIHRSTWASVRGFNTNESRVQSLDTRLGTNRKRGLPALFVRITFGGYVLANELFAKRCAGDPALPYADFHRSFQVFTNPDFLELETLGPSIELAPEETATHAENWSLHRDTAIAEWTDLELDRVRSLVS